MGLLTDLTLVITALQADLAGFRRQKTGDSAQQCRFAGTVGAGQQQGFTRYRLEGEPIYDDAGTASDGEFFGLKAQGWSGVPCAAFREASKGGASQVE